MTWFLCLVEIYNTIFVLVTVLFLKYGGENPKLFWVTVDFISLQIVRKRYFMFLQSIIVFGGKKPCSDSLDIIIRWFLHNSLYSSKHLFFLTQVSFLKMEQCLLLSDQLLLFAKGHRTFYLERKQQSSGFLYSTFCVEFCCLFVFEVISDFNKKLAIAVKLSPRFVLYTQRIMITRK